MRVWYIQVYLDTPHPYNLANQVPAITLWGRPKGFKRAKINHNRFLRFTCVEVVHFFHLLSYFIYLIKKELIMSIEI